MIHPASRLQKRKKSVFRKANEPFSLVGGEETPLLGKLARIRPSTVPVFLVLRQLAGASGFAWPSQRELAASSGMSKTEVGRALSVLHELGACIAVKGTGKRRSRYLVKRLDEGPLRDLSGPAVRALKKREIGLDAADNAKIVSAISVPRITKKRNRRKSSGTDATLDLFPYPLEATPAPVQEKQAGPSVPPVPAGRVAPSGDAPEKPGRAPETPAAPSGPPAGGGGRPEAGDVGAALGSCRVPLALYPALCLERRRTTVLQAAASAIARKVDDPVLHVCRAVLASETAEEGRSLRALVKKRYPHALISARKEPPHADVPRQEARRPVQAVPPQTRPVPAPDAGAGKPRHDRDYAAVQRVRGDLPQQERREPVRDPHRGNPRAQEALKRPLRATSGKKQGSMMQQFGWLRYQELIEAGLAKPCRVRPCTRCGGNPMLLPVDCPDEMAVCNPCEKGLQ